MLTGSLVREPPDGLWVSPEAATMGLYQLGILWALDQKPCPVPAREGPELGSAVLPLSLGQAELPPCSGTERSLLTKAAVDPG